MRETSVPTCGQARAPDRRDRGRRGRRVPAVGAAGPARRAVAAALLAGVAHAAAAPTGPAGPLSVTLTGVHGDEGTVRVALYAGPDQFAGREAFAARTVPPAASSTLSLAFEDLPRGRYAVLAYHDLDGDGTLDRGRFGIPVEPWTGSTTGSRFRSPSWSDYAFELSGDGLAIELSL